MNARMEKWLIGEKPYYLRWLCVFRPGGSGWLVLRHIGTAATVIALVWWLGSPRVDRYISEAAAAEIGKYEKRLKDVEAAIKDVQKQQREQMLDARETHTRLKSVESLQRETRGDIKSMLRALGVRQ